MNYTEMFNSLYPDFFRDENIRNMPSDHIFAELVMDLRDNSPNMTQYRTQNGISFGEYHGDPEPLRNAVRLVDDDWVQYFGGDERYYCVTDKEKVVSFCILSDMGKYRGLRVGGPGCVGTIPEYRGRGIGLEMVRSATETLRRDGFDISWIHHTHLSQWYMKLGYRQVLRWNGGGILN